MVSVKIIWLVDAMQHLPNRHCTGEHAHEVDFAMILLHSVALCRGLLIS